MGVISMIMQVKPIIQTVKIVMRVTHLKLMMDRGKAQGTTRSGRISYAPKYLLYNNNDNEEVANTAFTRSQLKYYDTLKKFSEFDDSDEISRTGSLIIDEIVLI